MRGIDIKKAILDHERYEREEDNQEIAPYVIAIIKKHNEKLKEKLAISDQLATDAGADGDALMYLAAVEWLKRNAKIECVSKFMSTAKLLYQ